MNYTISHCHRTRAASGYATKLMEISEIRYLKIAGNPVYVSGTLFLMGYYG